MGKWQDLWQKWLSPTDTDREGIPLTERQRKTMAYLLIVIVAAVVGLQFTGTHDKRWVLAPGTSSSGTSHFNIESVTGPGAPPRLEYEEEVERELAAILSQIEGVGNVQVFLSISTGHRQELAYDTTEETTVTEETDKQGGTRRVTSRHDDRQVVIVRDNATGQDQPVVLAEHAPVIAGVLVVAEGAQDPSTRLKISRAVEAAIAVPAHRVMVVSKKR